jgi:ATP-dependent protease HslVU (ClpYQ) peptidase subunit
MSSKLHVAVLCALLHYAHTQTVITLSGGSSSGTTSGSTNGVGTAALFSQPFGVAVDNSGNVIVADRANHKIRFMYPDLTVITLAGGNSSGTTLGSNNGVGTAALFAIPSGVAVDSLDNVIVADRDNNKIRLIYPNRTVITLAGGSTTGTTGGSNNGVGTAALFAWPFGVAVDTSGNVVVADTNNHKIRLIYPNLTVVTLAGGSSSGTTSGNINGVGMAALFANPTGVAVDTSGNVIVTDRQNHKIRLIYPNLTVITLAGGNSSGVTSGSNNGVGTAALFSEPSGVAVDTSGNVIAAEPSNPKIRLIYPNRTVITLAGGSTTGTTWGSINGVGTAALFNWPIGVAVDTSGNVIVADLQNHKIRLIYPFTCSPGTYANFTPRSCIMCPPGSFSSTSSAPSCSPCAAGTFAKPFGSTSCEVCPGGHYCPAGTSLWARLNCGRGNYCPDGSADPIPCPIQIVPVPDASWASHPLTAQGPAFLVETSSCPNHCFWNFTSGDGMLSKC